MEAKATIMPLPLELPLQQQEEDKMSSSITSVPPDLAKDIGKTSEAKTTDETEPDYITGFKLAILMSSITLVAFLMLLDMSIIVTVGQN